MVEHHLGHALDVAEEWLLVLEGRRIIYSNRGVPEDLNRSHDQVVGRRLEEVLPGRVYTGMIDLLEDMVRREGQMVTGRLAFENTVIGSSVLSVRGESRGGYTYLSINRPLMDGAESGERLMEVEDRLSALLGLTASAGMGVGVIEIQPDGSFLPRSFNEHILEIFNRPEHEMLSTSPIEFVHPEDRHIVADHIQELRQTGSTASPIQVRIIDGYGEEVHVQIANSMLSAPNENVGISFIQDITPIHDALDMQNRMVQAIERVEDTVILADAMGYIFYANPAALRNSGYTLEEVIGEPITVFNTPEASETFLEQVFTEFLKKGWWRGDVMACTKDGHQYPVEVIGSAVMDEQGELTMIVAISRMIEERQRFEVQLTTVKSNNERITEMLEDRLFPRLERMVQALEEQASAADDPKELQTLREELESTIAEGRELMTDLPVPETAGQLRSMLLGKSLAERLPSIVKRYHAMGKPLEVALIPPEPDVSVMANHMLPDLVMRLVDVLLDMASMERPRLSIEIGTISSSEVPGTMGIPYGDKGEPQLSTLTITAPRLKLGEDLRSIFNRLEVHTRGPLPPDVSFAVETSRLLLFLYKGRIFIQDGKGKKGDSVVLVMPRTSASE